MKIQFHRNFKKQFKKLPVSVQESFSVRLGIFQKTPKHPLLRIHTLQGSLYPLQSMNVTGDYRALFLIKNKTIIFYEINTHSELYK